MFGRAVLVELPRHRASTGGIEANIARNVDEAFAGFPSPRGRVCV